EERDAEGAARWQGRNRDAMLAEYLGAALGRDAARELQPLDLGERHLARRAMLGRDERVPLGGMQALELAFQLGAVVHQRNDRLAAAEQGFGARERRALRGLAFCAGDRFGHVRLPGCACQSMPFPRRRPAAATPPAP